MLLSENYAERFCFLSKFLGDMNVMHYLQRPEFHCEKEPAARVQILK